MALGEKRTTVADQRGEHRDPSLDHLFDFMRQLKDDMHQLNNALLSHMEHEENAMESLEARLEAGDKLMESMSKQLERLGTVHLAFVPDNAGNPDFIGHRMEHEQDRKTSELWQEGKKHAVGIAVEWISRIVSLGLIAWVALQVKGGT